MGFKDKIEKMISYFDTDDVNEVEELDDSDIISDEPSQPQKTFSKEKPEIPDEDNNQSFNKRQKSFSSQTKETQNMKNNLNELNYRKQQSSKHQSNQYQNNKTASNIPTIALKYPRRYEDATEIVDLLAGNECVLIDFQYMLEAQARRCLDFVDGASRVLSGNLQKVGSSMYLLTPQFVVVDVEEMNIPNTGQDINFDYDMKRR